MEENVKLKVGVAQIFPQFKDKEQNLEKIESFLKQAKKAEVELTVFPECTLTGYAYSGRSEIRDIAEPVPGPSAKKVEMMCRKMEVWTVIGLIEDFEGEFYNTAVLIGPGGIAVKYQKTHLPYQGADRFVTKGRGPLRIHDTSIGKMGLTICYDIFFPETVRVLTLQGLELLIVPTNWAQGVEFYVDSLCRSRAIENHINLIAANRVGQEDEFKFYGRSQIIDCKGKMLAQAGKEEELIMAEVDLGESQKKHIVRIPKKWEIDYLKDRRPELYRLLSIRSEEE
jgi:predicted amidohydrolase